MLPTIIRRITYPFVLRVCLAQSSLIAVFALVSLLFAFAGNSFGYVVGFYSYTMIAGYLWLNHFSELTYNHRLAGLSAAASAIAFLLPALFISSPVRQSYILSSSALDRLLTLILLSELYDDTESAPTTASNLSASRTSTTTGPNSDCR